MRLSVKRPGWLTLASGRRLSHDALFWSLQGGGWLVFGLMMLGYELAWKSPRKAVIGDIALVVTGIGLTTGCRLVYRAQRRRKVSPVILIGTSAGAAIAGSLAWYALQGLLSGVLSPYLLWSGFYPEVLLYYGFVLLIWTLLYFGINGWISLELERRRADRAEATAQSARLRALQAHLQPHFLFNTLNGISALVAEGRNHLANAMIARLSDFLRLTLQTAGTPEIALADDLVFVRKYLDIQKLRFGERLRYTFDIGPDAAQAMVPALLLQPLVENAVRHGILARAGGGRLIVSARTLDGRLLLKVDDDGPGMRKATAPSSGLGLSNTATRLTELYGNLAEFTVGRSEAGGVGVAIRIPLRERNGSEREEMVEE
jgi:two-component system, LytTR family, sensor kinase